jgi:ATP-dependent DNA helicase RecQ
VLTRVTGGYLATGKSYVHDEERYRRLLAGRRAEHDVMRAYLQAADTGHCRMQLLTAALDDPTSTPCGRCDVCTGSPHQVGVGDETVAAARRHLRGRDITLPPRRRWPSGMDRLGHDVRGNIPPEQQCREGRALAGGDDSGWGEPVARLLAASTNGDFADGRTPTDLEDVVAEVVDGLVHVLARWDWDRRPETIVVGPSRTHHGLLQVLANRLGAIGKLPVATDVLVRTASAAAQSEQGNSAHQAANALTSISLHTAPDAGPVLVLDASRTSGWSLTVAGTLLADAGAGPVLPLVLLSGTGS